MKSPLPVPPAAGQPGAAAVWRWRRRRIYSMPVYHALIAHGNFEKVLVCNAAHVRTCPAARPTR